MIMKCSKDNHDYTAIYFIFNTIIDFVVCGFFLA